MNFSPTRLAGAVLVRQERRADVRGYFARTFCADEFAANGLPSEFVQCNVSFNAARGTLRGMHWQAAPSMEGKLVRCSRGAIFDVAVDIRPESPTRLQWVGYELSDRTGEALYIPPGFAHGFQTLSDGCEVSYQMTSRYDAPTSRRARWNDPAVAISWPIADPLLSDADRDAPLFDQA